MTEELTNIKIFLKIAYDDDDVLLEELIKSAKAYITTVTGVEYSHQNELFNLVLKFLTALYYDNRCPLTDKSVNELPYTITSLLNTMELTRKP